MADTVVFSAQERTRVGKGAARAARREGRVPAVIYGAGKPPTSITIDPGDLRRQLANPGFFATLFDIEVGGAKEHVLCRDLQVHPVTDRPIHADFLRVTDQTRITVEVPVHFVNEEESPGIKIGGVLNIVRHEIEVFCRAGAIPQSFVIDLTGLEIGDSIHISHVDLPRGVAPTITDRDFTIATIAAPTVTPDDEEELEEGAEVEGEEGEEEAAGADEESGEGDED